MARQKAWKEGRFRLRHTGCALVLGFCLPSDLIVDAGGLDDTGSTRDFASGSF